MVDGLHEPLAIALSWAGKGSRGREGGSDLTNVQSLIGTVTMNPPHNEYIPIKNYFYKFGKYSNPSFLEGRNQEDCSLKPALANSSQDYSKTPNTRKGLGEWLKF
jgi:hypothetical protein